MLGGHILNIHILNILFSFNDVAASSPPHLLKSGSGFAAAHAAVASVTSVRQRGVERWRQTRGEMVSQGSDNVSEARTHTGL